MYTTFVMLTFVLFNVIRSVDVHLPVGIHRDAHLADVCVNVAVLISAK